MNKNKFYRTFLAYLALCSGSLIYSQLTLATSDLELLLQSKDISEIVTTCCNQKLYDKLGLWFSENEFDLNIIYNISENLMEDKLKNAVLATRNIITQDTVVKISTGEILQLALFIETNIKSSAQNGKSIFNPTDSLLKRSIEVDPKNGNIIIYLEDKSSKSVGIGRKKRFNVSILYSVDSPKIITTGIVNVPKVDPERRPRLLREAQIMNDLAGKPGIVECYSILRHDNISECYDELIFAERLYKGGSVKDLLLSKRYIFTISEQIKLATDFVFGLRSMLKYGIVHHDFHSGNYLIDIEVVNGKRRVSGAITDFGRAQFSKKHTLAKREKRYIFKIGVTLYGIFHNQYIPRGFEFERASSAEVISRRNSLSKKSKEFSVEERYEYLILNMMHDYGKNSVGIHEVLTELKAIQELIMR